MNAPSLLRDDRGAHLVEYLLIVGLIGIVAIAGFRVSSPSIDGKAQAQAVCVNSLACGEGKGASSTKDAPSRAEQIDQVAQATTNAATPAPGDSDPTGTPAGNPPPPTDDRNFGERLLDVGRGIVVDGLWGTLTGLYTAVTHPVETVQGIGYAITHPVATAQAIGDGLARAWEQNPERLIGAGIFELITLPVAAARVSRVTTVTRAADNLDDAADAARAANAVDEAAAAANRFDDPAQAAAALARRQQELGFDPHRGQYIPHEGEVGALIEGHYGGFRRDPSGDAEWIGVSGPYQGKSFDLLGLPEGTAQFHSANMERFLPSLDAHFRKSVDYVVLDTRFMTADQKATVLRHIETSWSQQRDRLILIQ